MTILVSGASGILGYGILKSLSKNNHLLIGTSIYDYSVAPLFCYIFEKAIRTDDPGYMDWLCSVIKKHKVDMIIPGIECDMYEWNRNLNILKEITFPLLNNSDLITLCYDKWLFYEKLISENPIYAIPTKLSSLMGYDDIPFLLKPRHGFGSQGIIKIEDKFTPFPKTALYGNDFMIQPIIGSDDEEYTTGAFFDNDSNLIDYITFRRKLSKQGWTEQAEVSDIECKDMLINLAEIFKPVGPTNFQFRVDDGLKLLEINPRISASTSIRALLGYNEAEISVNYFLDGKLPQPIEQPVGKRIIRYTEDYIL